MRRSRATLGLLLMPAFPALAQTGSGSMKEARSNSSAGAERLASSQTSG